MLTVGCNSVYTLIVCIPRNGLLKPAAESELQTCPHRVAQELEIVCTLYPDIQYCGGSVLPAS